MNSPTLRRTKSSVIILGILMLLLGLAFLFWPGITLDFVVLCCGWGFVIAAVATFIGFFTKSEEDRSAWDIVLSVLELILGVLILIFPGFFVSIFFVFVGCFVFVTGIFDIVDAISMSRVKGSLWGLWLALGVLTLLCGILMFANPLLWAVTFIWVAGVVLIFDGITEIVAGAMM